MKRLTVTIISLIALLTLHAREFVVHGPQGGLAMTITLPEGFDSSKDQCPMVILMHGIFSSQSITPMPRIAKSLAKAGIASIRFDFGGHWKSEGKMQRMTIENEISDAIAMWEYACSLPYVTEIGLLGHSQGGVVASMTAGRIASDEKYTRKPSGLALLAPASVLKDACLNGKMLGAEFDPADPPEFIRCFALMKVGKEYILQTQQLDIYGTAGAYDGPVIIIHGSDDKLVPLWCSEDFRKTYGDKSELIICEGENHRLSRKTGKVADLVVSFFKSIY